MRSLERLDNIISQKAPIPKGLKYMVPAVGIEPTRPQGTRDFESRASTSSTTPAQSCKGLKEQENLKNYILASGPCQGNKGISAPCR